jgi:hypothetical protein
MMVKDVRLKTYQTETLRFLFLSMALKEPSLYKRRAPDEGKSSGQFRRDHLGVSVSKSSAKSHLSVVVWLPGEDMDYRSWVREGGRIGSLARGSAWWLGDWLHYGTEKWGERYAKAAKITGYDPKTLRNMRYVASRFDPSLRRDNLTWSHHALLAALDADQQAYWLDRAAGENFSVEDLRTELRHAQKRHGQDEDPDSSKGHLSRSTASETVGGSSDLLCPQCGYQLTLEEETSEHGPA